MLAHFVGRERASVQGDALNLADPGAARLRQERPAHSDKQAALCTGLIIARNRSGLRTVDEESEKVAVVGEDDVIGRVKKNLGAAQKNGAARGSNRTFPVIGRAGKQPIAMVTTSGVERVHYYSRRRCIACAPFHPNPGFERKPVRRRRIQCGIERNAHVATIDLDARRSG